MKAFLVLVFLGLWIGLGTVMGLDAWKEAHQVFYVVVGTILMFGVYVFLTSPRTNRDKIR